jgi:hypothetical protein
MLKIVRHSSPSPVPFLSLPRGYFIGKSIYPYTVMEALLDPQGGFRIPGMVGEGAGEYTCSM